MNLFDTFRVRTSGLYSVNMILIYILVVVVLFIVCIVLSRKLSIYRPKVYKSVTDVADNKIILNDNYVIDTETADVRGVSHE